MRRITAKFWFKEANCALETNGDPGRIRTLDLLIRSQLLYPAELPDRVCLSIKQRLILATGLMRPRQCAV